MLLVVIFYLEGGANPKLYAEQLIHFPTGKMPTMASWKKNNENSNFTKQKSLEEFIGEHFFW